MIITALIYCIIILAICEGSCSALIFAMATFMFELFQGVSGDYYFMGAILFDTAIIIALSRMRNNVKLNMDLMTICGSFLMVNWISWYLWEAGLNYEFAYENISMLLYLGAIAILLNQDSIKNGYNKYHRQIGDFLMLNHKGRSHNNPISRKG
jgi:hypothetical protein